MQRAIDLVNKAGADRVVSPCMFSGRHMALLALGPRVVDGDVVALLSDLPASEAARG